MIRRPKGARRNRYTTKSQSPTPDELERYRLSQILQGWVINTNAKTRKRIRRT